MGIPKVEAEDLVALRDGESTDVGVDYAHETNFAIRRELLEARLLALALSMPKALPAAPSEPLDPELAGAYVTGTLRVEAARAFEATVRRDPRRFAALIEIKDAFFGRARPTARRSNLFFPEPEHSALGVLSVQVVGHTTLLSWDDGVVRTNFLAVASRRASLRFDADPELSFLRRMVDPFDEQAELLDRMVRQQTDLGIRLRELQGELMMARKSNRLAQLERVRTEIADLEQLSKLLINEFERMKESLDDMLKTLATQRLAAERADAEEWTREAIVEVFDSRLVFQASDTPGAIKLRLTAPREPKYEFTWVRPGKTFRMLEPSRTRLHTLGVIDDECLLLVDAIGWNSQPTYVLRVRRLEDVPA